MGTDKDSLVVRRDGASITAILNRPDKLNAIHKDVFEELARLLDVLETDRSARSLILTGAGDKAFSVGADLKERLGMTEKSIVARMEMAKQLTLRIEKLPFPTIAAMNGMAMGAGLEFALACDLRVVAEGAQLGLVDVELAAMPSNGGSQRLPRLIGLPKALEMVLLGKRLGASEALAMGLVNAVVPASQVLPTAKAWVGRMLEMGPLALRQAKAAIRWGMGRPLEEGLAWEIECYRPLLPSKDRIEGLKAFNEKRKPVFRGE